jgi:hypothetical protein
VRARRRIGVGKGIGIGAVVVAASLSPAAARASLSVDNPSRTSCPEAGAVTRAIVAQIGVGAASVGGGGEAWRLAYWPSGDGIQLQLRDQHGNVQLQRQVPGGAGDCRARAEAIALIADRFFQSLGWTAGRPLPPPEDVVAAAPVVSAPAPAPRPEVEVVVAAGGGLWTRRPDGATGVLGVRVARGAIEAGLHLLGPGADVRQSVSATGDASLSAWGLALSPALAWWTGRLRLRAGPAAVVAIESARSRGLPLTNEGTRATLALGLRAGLGVALTRHWRLDVEGGGDVAALGGRFVVTGFGPVLAPPRVQATAFAAVGWAF